MQTPQHYYRSPYLSGQGFEKYNVKDKVIENLTCYLNFFKVSPAYEL
jgi:hypothetical protein